MRPLILCLVLLFAVVGSLNAQAQSPAVFWAQGDIWAWSSADATLQPLTTDGTVSGLALSPDGLRMAYRVLSPVSRAALDQLQTTGVIADYDLPTDIYILDLQTRTSALLVEQPADANLLVEGGSSAVIRSSPVWSPAGDAVAWVEAAFQSQAGMIVVRNLVDDTLSSLAASMPLQDFFAPDLRWGQSGFAVRLTSQDMGTQSFAFYSAEGAPLVTATITPDADALIQEFTWVFVSELQQELLGVLLSSGRWLMIDPQTGSEVAITGVPVLYSLSAPDGPTIRFDVIPDTGFFWEAVFPQSMEASAAYSGAPGRVALSPDGQQMIFSGFPEFGGLAIWKNGDITPIAGTGSSDPSALAAVAVFWGGMGWRTD